MIGLMQNYTVFHFVAITLPLVISEYFGPTQNYKGIYTLYCSILRKELEGLMSLICFTRPIGNKPVSFSQLKPPQWEISRTKGSRSVISTNLI